MVHDSYSLEYQQCVNKDMRVSYTNMFTRTKWMKLGFNINLSIIDISIA